MPLYDVTFPYLRMMAGPVDYTPGAMRNAMDTLRDNQDLNKLWAEEKAPWKVW